MNFDALSYVNFHAPQTEFAKEFLQKFVPNMTWNNGKDIVMDVGCGPGNTTQHLLLPIIPEVETIIGIDASTTMIQAAEATNSYSKISYYVADITDECSLKRWNGQISHLVSTFCFNWIENQRTGFRNIYRLLRDNGEAILLFVNRTPFYDAIIEISNSSKWQEFTKNTKLVIPDSHFQQVGASYYKDMLEEIGFVVLACEEKENIFIYENNDEAKETIANICCLTSHIPEEMRNDFKVDLLEYTCKHNGVDVHGRLKNRHHAMRIHLQKSKEITM